MNSDQDVLNIMQIIRPSFQEKVKKFNAVWKLRFP